MCSAVPLTHKLTKLNTVVRMFSSRVGACRSAKRSQVDAAKKAVMDATRHVAARQRQAAAALGAVAEAEEGIREQESQLTGVGTGDNSCDQPT